MIIEKEVFDLVGSKNLSFVTDSFYLTGGTTVFDHNGNCIVSHTDQGYLDYMANSITDMDDRIVYDGIGVGLEEEMRAVGEEYIFPPSFVNFPEEEADVKLKLASVFNNETSVLARNMVANTNKISCLYNEIIILQRLVNIARNGIDKHPGIEMVIESINNCKLHNKVERVFVLKEEPCIGILTKEIITTELIDGAKRIVGKMLIKLPINLFVGATPSINNIYILNTSHDIVVDETKYQAPHVNYIGCACFGTSEQIIVDAIVKYDVSAVMCAIIQFLENPNMDDIMGSIAVYLPEVKE
jgi:hypothetical protein